MAQDHPTHHRHIELSLSWKLIVAFSLVFSIVFALAFWWFYDFSTKTALNQITRDMTATLTATIDGIDGDQFEALVKTVKPDDSGVPKDDPRLYRPSGVDRDR